MSEIARINTTSAPAAPTGYADAAAVSGQSQSEAFAQILSATMGQSLKDTSRTSMSSFGYPAMDYGSFSDSSATMESLLMGAMQTGEMGEIEMALFMLCGMMQSGGEDSTLSPILDMLAAILSELKTDAAQVKNSVLQSEYSPYVLSRIDSQVFQSAVPPALSDTGTAIVPAEAWKPVSPAIVSNETNRSPETLRQVIDQFGVETSLRYQPYRRGNDTYCNIFLWDVTSALGCEIPHYVDPVTGQPRRYPDIKGAVELGAVATEDWLERYGPSYGWREVNALTAQNYANQGKPAVTTAGSIGHVQVVCPSSDGGFDPIRGVTVAQAGSRNIGYTHLTGIYSSASVGKIRYFVHE